MGKQRGVAAWQGPIWGSISEGGAPCTLARSLAADTLGQQLFLALEWVHELWGSIACTLLSPRKRSFVQTQTAELNFGLVLKSNFSPQIPHHFSSSYWVQYMAIFLCKIQLQTGVDKVSLCCIWEITFSASPVLQWQRGGPTSCAGGTCSPVAPSERGCCQQCRVVLHCWAWWGHQS